MSQMKRYFTLSSKYSHSTYYTDILKWVWTRRGGCGQDEMGVDKTKWVWTRRSGCGQDEVGVDKTEMGVANKNTYVRVHIKN